MARAGHLAAEPVGVGQGATGIGGGFHHVDVVVDGAGMVGLAPQHVFQRREDLGRAPLGPRAGRLPVIPGRQVHQGFDMQQRDLRIVRIARCRLAHGLRIGRIERGTVGLGVAGIAAGECRDQVAFAGAGLACRCLRPRDRSQRRGVGRGVHRRIDVGAQHQRLAPVAHGALRIQALRLAERPRRLGVVEGIGQPQSLVEITLGERNGRADRKVQRAEVIPQRRGRERGFRSRRRLGREGAHLGLGGRELLVIAHQPSALVAPHAGHALRLQQRVELGLRGSRAG